MSSAAGLPASSATISSSSSSSSSTTTFARSFDAFAYKRLKDAVDFTDASSLGGILSLLAWCTAGMLFFFELFAFLSVDVVTSIGLPYSSSHLPGQAVLGLDPIALAAANSAVSVRALGSDGYIRMTFNISFPRIPCSLLSLQVSDTLSPSPRDILGSDANKNIHRYKIDTATGNALMRMLDDGSPSIGGVGSGGGGGGGGRALGVEYISTTETEKAASIGGGTLPDFSNTKEAQPLDADNFDAFIAANELTLVAFGAPWCPYSRQLSPVLEETAKVISTVKGVRIGKVDCTQPAAQLVCQKQHIAAFPTVFLYKGHSDHSHLQYNGDRTPEALLAFLVRAQQNMNLVTAPDEQSAGDAAAHAEAIARQMQLTQLGADNEEQDPANPGKAWSLIESMHKAGLHAPGDAARAAARVLGAVDDAAAAAAQQQPGDGNGANSTAPDGECAPVASAAKGVEGCQIAGFIDLRRVPGHFRVVIKPEGSLMSANAAGVNTTHVIHDLWFGPRLTAYQLGRLPQGVERDMHRLRARKVLTPPPPAAGNLSTSHWLRVVPSRFSFRSGYTVDTFQYSVQSHSGDSENGDNAVKGVYIIPSTQQQESENYRNYNNEKKEGIFQRMVFPTVSFSYDISPLSVSVTEVRKPFYAFLTSCCAIVGGVFTVVSLFDTILHGAMATLKARAKAKNGLGKLQ